MLRSIKDFVLSPIALYGWTKVHKTELYDPNDTQSRPHVFPEDWSEFFKNSYENNLEAVTLSVSTMENEKLINQTDSNGFTALHIAVSENADKVVKFLLEKGIDYNIQNKRGYTAFEMCVASGHKDFVNLMIDTGKVPKGMILNVENETALFLAVANDHFDTTSKLVEYYNKTEGAETTKQIVNHPNNHQVAPIFLATLKNDVKTVKLLIDNGCNVNTTKKDGNTPIHNACSLEDPSAKEVVELLLKSGADYTILNGAGKSAVEIAFNNKDNMEIYQVVREFLNQSEAGKAILEKLN